jgi:5'-nucleotidase
LRRTRLSLAAALAVATSAVLVGVPAAADAAPKAKPDKQPIPVQLVAMNDFHGRIQNTTNADSQQVTAPGPDGAYGTGDDIVATVGGSANVATTVKRVQNAFLAENPGSTASFFVGAGDLISASPFESSIFKDEPTIEILNAMGLDVSSVGNHELDRGTDELRRISAATDGTYTDDVVACPETLGGEAFEVGVDGCFGEGEHAFHGADFPYLAANVISKETGQPMLPPYQVYDVAGGQKVALIGVTTETTPTLVAPTGIEDVTVIDEADAVNRWVKVLHKQGIRAVGVLVHEGGTQNGPTANNPNGCATLTGPIVDINDRLDPRVDLIVSAHTHSAYNCLLPAADDTRRLVTSAGYYGRLVSDIRLMIKPSNGDVDRAATYQATNVAVTRTAPDAAVQRIVDYWVARSAGPKNIHAGVATADINRARNTATPPVVVRDRESSLGNLIAQTQLDALRPNYGNPVVAFMNPGGLRTDIAAGDVTYGELYDVQPFANNVNAITMTGAEIKQLLEQQFPIPGVRTTQLWLGTSAGFAYNYDPARALNDRIDPCSVMINGVRVDPATSYRVVANSFLTAGGDNFSAFLDGDDLASGPVDVETSFAYFQKNSPVAPPAADHATLTTQRLSC